MPEAGSNQTHRALRQRDGTVGSDVRRVRRAPGGARAGRPHTADRPIDREARARVPELRSQLRCRNPSLSKRALVAGGAERGAATARPGLVTRRRDVQEHLPVGVPLHPLLHRCAPIPPPPHPRRRRANAQTARQPATPCALHTVLVRTRELTLNALDLCHRFEAAADLGQVREQRPHQADHRQ